MSEVAAGEPDNEDGEVTELATEAKVLREALESLARDGDAEVQWPKGAGTQATRVQRNSEFNAWLGKPEALKRLAGNIDDALKRAFEQAKDDIAQESTYLRPSVIESYVPEARVSEGKGRMERRGDLSTILSEVDPSAIEWLEIGNSGHPYGQPRAKVNLRLGYEGRNTYTSAVELTVEGADLPWVAGTFETLSSEIARGVPWWAFFRGDRALVVYLALFFPLLYGWAYLAAPEFTRALFSALFIGLVVGMLSIGVHWLVKNWVLPPFQVLEAGDRSRAAKMGAVLGGLIGVAGLVLAVWQLVESAPAR